MPLRTEPLEEPQLNLTPMIDVVFLLLIFFMTVSQVSKINKERLDLPQQQGAEEQPEDKPAFFLLIVDLVHGRFNGSPDGIRVHFSAVCLHFFSDLIFE